MSKNLLVNIVTTFTMSQMSRTVLLKSIYSHTAPKLQDSKLTVSIASGAGMISEGSLEPAAMVTVMCDPTFTSQGASDMVVGVASAFREGFEMDATKIKFAFIEHKFSV
ncbi:hypothetical protein GUITHDRAFT_151040 [Guillardia theta CCMP2712]|uniref:Uncharacterized protein n=1 Tax=Guillardia theta (strain CCMP2712) TaxID=905079 RepID=L1JT25_GUITC|nr:hypothetical protein GUITHDRAFT_151040 [Guillardia theta CCMP2712]EKX51320.1 hypothetical protein GUITHDRAFT_151040 [Guillardia theta CCMP2712]|mmetsp:Transcript_22165/g.72971  ORF Transcript_22165/g.72971 Transcript_22165/m.72971 type:complete len:109 (-) Transcript_22165:955-1281(-)|eukprot:XP_005838300.1 hypothetical protein GUITHDRAFT_151040 [Guillardia theta CCMP2712]